MFSIKVEFTQLKSLITLEEYSLMSSNLKKICHETDHLKQSICFSECFVPVDLCVVSPFIPEEHIFTDREKRYKRQLLMNDDYTFFFTVFYILKFAYFSIINDIAVVCAVGVDAAENAHQC